MFKLKLQLLIERILSGAKPYIASHPELGVPLGIFNYKDEPDYNSRVNSILKQGKEGNKLYTLENKHTLMHSVDPEVVARVAQQILEVVPIEDWEKKNQDR